MLCGSCQAWGTPELFRAPTRFQNENYKDSVNFAREKLPPVEEMDLCIDYEQRWGVSLILY